MCLRPSKEPSVPAGMSMEKGKGMSRQALKTTVRMLACRSWEAADKDLNWKRSSRGGKEKRNDI